MLNSHLPSVIFLQTCLINKVYIQLLHQGLINLLKLVICLPSALAPCTQRDA